MSLTNQQRDKILELINECTEAEHEDREMNAHGCGCNPLEVWPVLREVAEILEIPWPEED